MYSKRKCLQMKYKMMGTKRLKAYKSINLICLSVIVSNKRLYGRTDRTQILCGTSHDPKEGLWMLKITKIVSKSFLFL